MRNQQINKINGVHFHKLFNDFTIECVNRKPLTHQEKVRQYARERVIKIFPYKTGLSEEQKKLLRDVLREEGNRK